MASSCAMPFLLNWPYVWAAAQTDVKGGTKPSRTIPAELQPGFTFAGVLTRSAENADAATALLRFLNSPEADAVKTKAGLMPAGP